MKNIFKSLFCKHNYKASGINPRKGYTLLACDNCGKKKKEDYPPK